MKKTIVRVPLKKCSEDFKRQQLDKEFAEACHKAYSKLKPEKHGLTNIDRRKHELLPWHEHVAAPSQKEINETWEALVTLMDTGEYVVSREREGDEEEYQRMKAEYPHLIDAEG